MEAKYLLNHVRLSPLLMVPIMVFCESKIGSENTKIGSPVRTPNLNGLTANFWVAKAVLIFFERVRWMGLASGPELQTRSLVRLTMEKLVYFV